MNSRFIELFSSPTSAEWLRLIIVVCGLAVSVGASEIIRKRFHWSAEVTRKLVHVSVGVLLFFLPVMFQSALIPFFVACLAAIIMTLAVQKEWLAGIHGTARHSYGTAFYPLAYAILIFLFWGKHPEIISLAIGSLALGDAAAAIVGESISAPIEYRLTSDKKSLQGSLAMFGATSITLLAGIQILDIQRNYPVAVLLQATVVAAILSTAWEAISSKGLDNLTVPLSVAFVFYYFLVPSAMADSVRFEWGIVFSLVVAAASYKAKFLTASGSVATFLLASLIYALGGWQWTVPILTFFILSSILSKLGKTRKQKVEHLFEKSGVRDWGQVAANGGPAGIIILLQFVFPELNFYPYFLGALAAVTADTWGTEIGTWYRGTTYSLVSWREVETGTNGGVSLAGTLGGWFGASLVAASALWWGAPLQWVWVASGAGVIGSIVDSILGGTLQASYRCEQCQKRTERIIHCGRSTVFQSGMKCVTNDTVNWICAGAGVLCVVGTLMILNVR